MKGTALVTGAAGFIGSHIVERMLHLGYTVVGLDNFDEYYSPAIKRDNICHLKPEHGFLLQEGDIRDTHLLARLFSENQFNVVVHLAARAGVRPSLEHPLVYQDVNIRGTVNLLEASRASSIKQFLFASSSSVYGRNGQTPFHERLQVGCPVSPYAASKAAAELFCYSYSHLYSPPITVLRLFTFYGPRQRPEMAIHRFVRMIQNHEEITLYGRGKVKRDFTYIEDIVDGFAKSLLHPQKDFNIFNLGAGNAVDLSHLINVIEEALGEKANIRHQELQPGEVPVTFADISKAYNILGYQPRVSLEEGISRFVHWYSNTQEVMG
jgi:UDP-glucuronate 4-epimerase